MRDKYERATNYVQGYKQIHLLAQSVNADDSGWKLIWGLDSATPTLPDVDSPDEITAESTDAADTELEVEVTYLDNEGHERMAVFVLDDTDATTPVSYIVAEGEGGDPDITLEGIRIQSARCRAAHVGVIKVAIGAEDQVVIPAGSLVSNTGLYTVPKGQRALIKNIQWSCESASPTSLRLRALVPGESDWITWAEWGPQQHGSIYYDVPRLIHDWLADGSFCEELITLALEAKGESGTDNVITAMVEIEAIEDGDPAAVGYRR